MAKLPHDSSLVSTVGDFATTFANITTDSSFYDDYVYVHSDLNPVIHFTGKFLKSPYFPHLDKAFCFILHALYLD